MPTLKIQNSDGQETRIIGKAVMAVVLVEDSEARFECTADNEDDVGRMAYSIMLSMKNQWPDQFQTALLNIAKHSLLGEDTKKFERNMKNER